jgi:hypothetical protein
LLGGLSPLGFDTDPIEPDYAARFSHGVSVVDTARAKGQVALFDRLLTHDSLPKIIDVNHRFYRDFLNTVDEIGFLDEAALAMVQPIFLFHSVATEPSREEFRNLSRRWRKLCLVAVFNKGVIIPGSRMPEITGPTRFIIGALDSVARTCFEAADFSLTDFTNTPPLDMSFVTHMALRIWIKTVFDQFRLFEIAMATQGSGLS